MGLYVDIVGCYCFINLCTDDGLYKNHLMQVVYHSLEHNENGIVSVTSISCWQPPC